MKQDKKPLSSEAKTRFAALKQATDPRAAGAIESLVRQGSDAALNRVNVLDFAAAEGLNEEVAIAAFLHAARLGLFDMSWNLLCPGCGGVLEANTTLKTMRQDTYTCALCGAGYEPTLDEMVEVSFTVCPRLRRIAAHDPHTLPMWDYYRQVFWSSGIAIPENSFEDMTRRIVLDAAVLFPGEKCVLSVQLPAQFIIVFDPVTHTAQFIDVKGSPTQEIQNIGLVFNKLRTPTANVELRPGPLRLSLENRTDLRVLPGVFVAAEDLHRLLGTHKRFLTATRLLTNQTFRDLYKTDTLDIDQRLKITSLTFLFTDLKGSTELYERVGDLVAYDLVRNHFQVVQEVVSAETGAVVKTIGDAVMATFPTPDRGLAAALRMRDAMRKLNEARQHEDLLLKIGVHEGPCLAVTLNERQDYFGQTVNIAARVQGLAVSRAIYATKPIVENADAARLLHTAGLVPVAQRRALRGIAEELTVYQIP